MNIKTYRKLTASPLGLGRGLVITTEVFTDKGLDDVNKKKLKSALDQEMVAEIDAKATANDNANDLDQKADDLAEQLAEVTKQRDDALAELAKLKQDEPEAWITMTDVELAAAYTVPELKGIIRDNFPDAKYARNAKEAECIAIILEHREVKE